MSYRSLRGACAAGGSSTPADLGGHWCRGMGQRRRSCTLLNRQPPATRGLEASAVLPESSAFYLLASTAFQPRLMSRFVHYEWIRKVTCKSALGSPCGHLCAA